MQKLTLIKGYNVMNCPSGKTPLLCKEVTAAQTCWSLRLPCSKVSIKTCLLNDLPRRSFVTFLKMDSISNRALQEKKEMFILKPGHPGAAEKQIHLPEQIFRPAVPAGLTYRSSFCYMLPSIWKAVSPI